MMELNDDKLYEDGKEVSPLKPLNDYELDQLIKQFDPSIKSTRDWSKKQSSWSGVPWPSMDWFIDDRMDWSEIGRCDVSNQVYEAGGVRLLTLYCNKFNFFSAATDLGIEYAALIKWFQRWKAKAIKEGITPQKLGLYKNALTSEDR